MKDGLWLRKRKTALLRKKELSIQISECRKEISNLDKILMNGEVHM